MPWNIIVGDSQVLAIHAALLPTGEILYFGGDEHSQAQHDAGNIDHTRLFRLSDNAILPMASPTTDVFCSGHAQLADGRILVGGGTKAWVGETPEHNHALGFNRPLVGLVGDIGHTTRHAPRIDSPFGNGNMLSWQLPSVAQGHILMIIGSHGGQSEK